MALSNRSLSQAKQVLAEILYSHVDVIVTRAALDKRIELIKFPYLKPSHDRHQKNKTLYVSRQYDPIRYWLIKNKFLTQNYESGKYIYTVNRDIISAFLRAENDRVQSNNNKTKKQKVMTKKERVFRHIEDNGNAMRYTDIIKFAYEITHGTGSFDKRENRGYYACAFTYHSYWSAMFGGQRKKNIGSPKGHFVIPTKSGHLIKLPNGLWSVVRPSNWKRDNIEMPKSKSHSNSVTVISKEEYESMCCVLKKYNITANELDNLATEYFHKKNGDGASCYQWAYYDLLEKAGVISDTTKELQKEIDALADHIIAQNKPKETMYAVVSEFSVLEGILTKSELELFFSEDRDVNKYMIFEAGNSVQIEKKVTTTITIK